MTLQRLSTQRKSATLRSCPTGRSLTRAFNGKKLRRKKPIYWEHEGNRAMRDGKWKLVAKGSTGPWELYDIEADRTELNNLAEKHPKRLKRDGR